MFNILHIPTSLPVIRADGSTIFLSSSKAESWFYNNTWNEPDGTIMVAVQLTFDKCVFRPVHEFEIVEIGED